VNNLADLIIFLMYLDLSVECRLCVER